MDLLRAADCSADKVAEEWVRSVGPRKKLWVELRSKHPRMIAQLADFNQRTVR
jgi:hypothetical protein